MFEDLYLSQQGPHRKKFPLHHTWKLRPNGEVRELSQGTI